MYWVYHDLCTFCRKADQDSQPYVNVSMTVISLQVGFSLKEHDQEFGTTWLNLHGHSIDDQGYDLSLAEMVSVCKIYRPDLG